MVSKILVVTDEPTEDSRSEPHSTHGVRADNQLHQRRVAVGAEAGGATCAVRRTVLQGTAPAVLRPRLRRG